MRRVLSTLLFMAIVAGGTRPQMLAALRPRWRSSRAAGIPIGLSQLPLRFARDPMPDQLVAFIESVQRNTPAGAAVAVVLPAPWNTPETLYAQFRMSYVLAGHPVVLAADPNSAEAQSAAYVAVWPDAPSSRTGTVVYRGHEGTLIRTAHR